MKKLFLHIGTEKTGTTSIQNCLEENRAALAAQGYHVFQYEEERNHRALVSYCLTDTYFDDYLLENHVNSVEKKLVFKKEFYRKLRDQLNALDDNIHSVIISSEHFHSRLCEEDELIILKQLLSQFFSEVKIICYLREQSSLAASRYSTGIKSGVNRSIEDFLAECTVDYPYYNYDVSLDHWSRVFPLEDINLRIFAKEEFINNNLIDDFFSCIDSSLTSKIMVSEVKENSSLSHFGKTIGRAINSISPRFHRDGRINKNRQKALRVVSKSFGGPHSILNLEQCNQIYDTFFESNQRVAKKFFKDRDVLFQRRKEVKNYEPILEEQIEGFAEAILAVKKIEVVSRADADVFRKAAELLENIDLPLAYNLMLRALQGQQENTEIRKKVREYEEKL